MPSVKESMYSKSPKSEQAAPSASTWHPPFDYHDQANTTAFFFLFFFQELCCMQSSEPVYLIQREG
jgi:hypothetical protein